MSMDRSVHVPIMVHEILDQLALAPGLTIVDGTVGGGGHSAKITAQAPENCRLIGLDRDPEMLRRAAVTLAGVSSKTNVTLHHASYAELDRVLDELGLAAIDRVLLDLGLSSDQLADSQRGFGFETSGPLDMRFDTSQGTPAAELLATASRDELLRIFREYGEEPQAEAFVQALDVAQRSAQSPRTAAELVAFIEHSLPRSSRKSHPATRIFQALRIAVNRELEQLETFLSDVLPRRLAPGGRALIITFHSLEDRLVKQAFRKVDLWDTLTPRPIVPTPSEVRWNPRSRSAKLRVAQRKATPA